MKLARHFGSRGLSAVWLCVLCAAGTAWAQHPDTGRAASEPLDSSRLPANVTTRHSIDLPGGTLRFTATAGAMRLQDGKDAPLTDVSFVAYQVDGADIAYRPVTFVLNGGPGMASAWLQMGAVGPWRVRLDVRDDGPSASPVPIANLDTWLDFTDLVFIDTPGTGYSRILAANSDARRRLWSVAGDIEALATAIRKWLGQNGRIVSPKYILGESYGGFRGPRLARELQANDGVGINGLILLSPLLDVHEQGGYADPLAWVDLLPSEVAVARAGHGPVTRADMADVEAYAAGDYLVDILRGPDDPAAIDRLVSRVASLTAFDPALLRRLGGRLDSHLFQQTLLPHQVVSVYDGTAARANPSPRALDSRFPDPVLDGFEAPVTSGMLAVYADKLNWRPDMVYSLSNNAAFAAWDWGRGMSTPESLTPLQAARSVDPHLHVLIAQGLYDLRTPYFTAVRQLRLLPPLAGVPPVKLSVYPGGHMFYFADSSRTMLRDDARTMLRDDARELVRDDAKGLLRDAAKPVSDPGATGGSR